MKQKIWFFLFILSSFSLFNSIPGLLFWPGSFSPDSFDQLEYGLQITPYINNHPVTMAYLMGLMSSQRYEVFSYLALQLLFISLAGTMAVYLILDRFSFAPRRKYFAAFLLSGFLCLCPPNGLYAIIIWKDVPFAWLCFLLATVVTEIWRTFDKPSTSPWVFWRMAMLAGICAGLMMHFRHNAYTVAVPAIFLVLLPLVEMFRTDRKKALIALVFTVVGFGGVLLPREVLKFHLMPDPANRNYYDDFDIKSFVYRADFFQALKLGMTLTDDERAALSKFIDIPASLERMSLENSVYAIHPVFVGDRRELEPEFIRLAARILQSRPGFWILSKIRYTAELVYSLRGYQVPNFENNVRQEAQYKVHLSPNPKFQSERGIWISLMRTIYFGRYAKIVFWSFVPVLAGFIAIGFITALRIHRRGFSYETASPLVSVALATTLFVSLALVSASNDFRYFWPLQFFLIASISALIIGRVNGANRLAVYPKTPATQNAVIAKVICSMAS